MGQSPGATGVRVRAPWDQRGHDAHKDQRLIPLYQLLELTLFSQLVVCPAPAILSVKDTKTSISSLEMVRQKQKYISCGNRLQRIWDVDEIRTKVRGGDPQRIETLPLSARSKVYDV